MTTEPSILPPPEVSIATPVAVGPPVRTGGGSSRLIDLTNQRFGRLLVLTRAENSKEGKARWNCRCDCGQYHMALSSCLRNGTTSSCGCLRSELLHDTYKDISGEKFGQLTAVSRVPPVPGGTGSVKWNCACDCGANVIVSYGNLSSGHTKSCGCARELCGERFKKDLTGIRFGRLVAIRAVGKTDWRNITWECACDCGATHIASAGHLTHGDTKSCGCLSAEIKREANINPLLTDEDRIRRRLRTQQERRNEPTATHKVLAQATFKRDDYTCCACGSRGCKLEAHHLEPWAFDRDLRYDPANLVTLCKECHDQFHLLYGKEDCTIEDFEEYLKP